MVGVSPAIFEGVCYLCSPTCRFADPTHWLKHFPPCAMGDLKALGLKVRGRAGYSNEPKQ